MLNKYYFTAVSLLSLSSSLVAMKPSQIEVPTTTTSSAPLQLRSLKLTDDKFVLTHKTNFFPKNGVMIPGLSFREASQYVDVTQAPNLRLTLHWFGMGMHVEHENNKNKEKYLIIENGALVKDRIQCGYHQDFMMVGPHQLSDKSIAIVPQEEFEELKKGNPLFKGAMVPYDKSKETLEKASFRILQEMQIPDVKPLIEYAEKELSLVQLLQVQMMITHDPSIQEKLIKKENTVYLVEELMPQDQRIEVEGQKVKAREYYLNVFSEGFKWTPHEETDLGQFEGYGTHLFSSLLDLQSPKPVNSKFSKAELVKYSKGFSSLYQKISKLTFETGYKVDNDLVKEYMSLWKSNVRVWYALVQQQSQELDTMPYEKTLFGNTDRLKIAIQASSQKLQSFNPDNFLKNLSQ